MTANRIHSKGNFRHEEAVASAAGIYPGMLVYLTSAGEIAVHATEGGALGDEVLVVGEDALQGNTVDTVYTIDTKATYYIPAKGSVMNMLLEDGQDLSIGEKVMSAGNGKIKATDDIESGDTLAVVIGIAEEACDLTGSDSDDTITPIRIV